MREKTEMLHFRVSPQELARINQKRHEIGIHNMGAYLRKMAMDGYCFNLDPKPVLEISSLIRRCSSNLNQYAKRANETGSIYAEDIKDLQVRLDEIWENQAELLKRLSDIR
ncbi:MAG: plasmid mobilization relaxosome protein MobC [Eubacteriales bacterium]|nr:plasmid mobilization relaxosome protein MobC [Eubacteriales bacterium]